jgi:hypothetical protein
MNAKTSNPLVPCDSCGQPATPEHIRDRIQRLERATRYRPIHVSLLLICTAPPARAEDDLYALEQEQGSAESRAYLGGLLACVGIDSTAFATPAAQLAELQHRGIYLARLVECPLRGGASVADLAADYGATLLKRIALSYKPKRIALLDPAAPGLVELLLRSQFSSLLINQGQGIDVPDATDATAVARVRAMLAE